jgi:hypothetical protein
MDMQHDQGKSSNYMDMVMQHGEGHGHALWTKAYSMDKDMKHGQGHAAWTWTRSMDLVMKH